MKVLLPYAIGGLLGGGLLKSLFKGPKKPPGPQQPVQRDDARDAALRNDELLRRRGGAADIVTGAYGAEAPPGGKTTLGS
jgi:hypothetical protein